ncbi:hypothetical protein BJ165DRAFT_1403549 [Panaeolus papilionaceus]|nr:hypothetical protein BJ165DRAFT_1403549 [Panaeolus papilionaceus]
MTTQPENNPDDERCKDLNLVPIADLAIQFKHGRDAVFLVMGPTGAGKSRFIEALAGNDALGISKDQLDSVTQVITTYQFTNINLRKGTGTSTRRCRAEDGQVYILDTPGFSDSHISEFEIIKMVSVWMNTHNCSRINTIFYLWPITDTRLPGSKRRTIEMLKLLAAINTDQPGEIIVITTMWDRLWNERTIAAAEERFVQLRDHVWKDLQAQGGLVIKFTNTHSSAIDCLKYNTGMLLSGIQNSSRERLRDETYGPHLYHDLLERIQAAQQRNDNMKAELGDPVVQSNQELKALTEEQLQKAEQLLTKFEGQLISFGEPPVGFEESLASIQSIVDKHHQRVSDARVAVFGKAKNFLTLKLRDIGHKIRK